MQLYFFILSPSALNFLFASSRLCGKSLFFHPGKTQNAYPKPEYAPFLLNFLFAQRLP